MTKYRLSLYAVLLLVLIFSSVRYARRAPSRNFSDFHVYYVTGQRLLEGNQIYDPRDNQPGRQITPFKYMPIVAFVFAPLAFFDEHAASMIWFVLNFFFCIGIFYCSARLIMPQPGPSRARLWILYALVIAATLRVLSHSLDSGQINTALLFLTVGAIYCIHQGRQAAAGAALGMGTMMKYLPVIFVPYFLLKKKTRFFVFFLISVVFFVTVPAVLIGVPRYLNMVKDFIPFIRMTSLDRLSLVDYVNQSVLAALNRFFSAESPYPVRVMALDPKSVEVLAFLVCAGLYAVALLPARRRFALVDYGLLFVCIPLFNPNGWIHNFISLIFPYMLVAHYLLFRNAADRLIWFLLAASIGLQVFFGVRITALITKQTWYLFSSFTVSALLLFTALVLIKFDHRRCSYLS